MNHLKELRKRAGLTLAELSKRTGYGVSTINNLENGRTAASDVLLKKLAGALGTSPAKLLNARQHGEMPAARPFVDRTSEQAADPDSIQKVYAMAGDLSVEDLEAMLAANVEELKKSEAEDKPRRLKLMAHYVVALHEKLQGAKAK